MKDTRKKIFCIMGETGSGKDTLVNKLFENEGDIFKPVISYTNRPKRQDEVEGREHYFLTKDEFKEKRLKFIKENKLAGYVKFSTKKSSTEYMTSIDELNEKNIYIIDPEGLKFLKKHVGEKVDLVSIYIWSPFKTRKERVTNQKGESEEIFRERTKSEKNMFDNFYRDKKFDYIIHNLQGKLNLAYDNLLTILNYELNERNILEEPIYINKSEYTKSELMDAIKYVENVTNMYVNQYSTDNLLTRNAKNKCQLVKDIILSVMR